ncbi:hypothetical protein QFZ79_000897 [Arthrobacter sp. V4I6]|uniref:hypothetical protein n=1 Tax=Arthrobacter sp. V1I7 TaxID=3042274 RepID=UPI00277E7E55|nr:hypothetical protein [Arthrobacter sp. V1I7]MDQ0823155.1 hypothetical protein [Arthrobacter sp. V1I7]MDQ0852786.1 hypothetical protein [Arthrobacter sp. V4I6]
MAPLSGPRTRRTPGYWLSTLPGTTRITEIVRLVKISWRTGHDYRELKYGLGLDEDPDGFPCSGRAA